MHCMLMTYSITLETSVKRVKVDKEQELLFTDWIAFIQLLQNRKKERQSKRRKKKKEKEIKRGKEKQREKEEKKIQ